MTSLTNGVRCGKATRSARPRSVDDRDRLGYGRARMRARTGTLATLLCTAGAILFSGCAQQPRSVSCAPDSVLAICREECGSDGDCLAPARCEPSTHSCQMPAIACDPLLSGADCLAQQECELVTRTCTPRPGASCKSDGDCRLGERCGDGSCVPTGSPALCARDGDCTPPGVCRPTVDAARAALILLCGAAIGPSEAGARCRENLDCQSGLCLRTGVCFGGCTPATLRSDCHGHDSVICGQLPLAIPQDQTTLLTSCALLPPACSSDRDCEPTGGSCQPIVNPENPTALRASCLPARGLGRPSASCRRDSDCISGLCQSGLCFAACSSTADCQPGFSCHPATYVVDGVSGQLSSCISGP